VADVGQGRVTGRLVTKADARISKEYEQRSAAETEDGDPAVVLGSGNLGLLYLRGTERLTLDELTRRWPALVDGLATHPGISFVAGIDDSGTPWAIGGKGRRNLATGEVEGDDPLAPFGDHAARVMPRAVLMPESPDLYVNSVVDEHTNDVAAFEHLVGAHGGLGGWQDSAMVLAPRDLAAAMPDRIEGADALHRVLVGMLEACGQRGRAPEDATSRPSAGRAQSAAAPAEPPV
jgi:hypothetical protein